MMSGVGQVTTNELLQRLANGEAVEIAGYMLSPELFRSISAVALESLPVPPCPVDWVEIIAAKNRSLSAGSRRTIDYWQSKDVNLSVTKVVGEPFWNTPEITVVPSLLNDVAQRPATA